jgi:hypothetical protein
VADCPDRNRLRALGQTGVSVGGGSIAMVADWPRLVRVEKAAWEKSITGVLRRRAPGIIEERRQGRTHSIDEATVHRLRTALGSDSGALADIEIAGMRSKFGPVPELRASDPGLRARLALLLEVHARAFIAAILDIFDGPHNPNRKKIRLEENDWYDLAQLRYVQAGTVWVTLDKRWVTLAPGAGLQEYIRRPIDIG